jgi:hypothetical protein
LRIGSKNGFSFFAISRANGTAFVVSQKKFPKLLVTQKVPKIDHYYFCKLWFKIKVMKKKKTYLGTVLQVKYSSKCFPLYEEFQAERSLFLPMVPL